MLFVFAEELLPPAIDQRSSKAPPLDAGLAAGCCCFCCGAIGAEPNEGVELTAGRKLKLDEGMIGGLVMPNEDWTGLAAG